MIGRFELAIAARRGSRGRSSYVINPRKEALRLIHRMATIPEKFLSAAAVCRSIALGPLGLSTVTETVPQLPHAYVLT